MREIKLDASTWATAHDFYRDLLKQLGAPEWHGFSIDALIDTMIWGGINAVDPPYVVRIYNLQAAPDNVREYVRSAQSYIAEGREDFRRQEEHDVEVCIDIVS